MPYFSGKRHPNQSALVDSWGAPIKINLDDAKGVYLVSAGPNGKWGDDDDLLFFAPLSGGLGIRVRAAIDKELREDILSEFDFALEEETASSN